MSELKTAGLIIYSALVALIIILFLTTQKPANTAFNTAKAQAHSYRVIVAEFYPHPDHRRVAWHITAPDAVTIDDRAATARNAAQKLYEETTADEVVIWLQADARLIGTGLILAKVDAFPARDQFEVTATNTIFSARDIEISATFKALYPQYIHGDAFDETGLYREVRARFSLPDAYRIAYPPIQQPISVFDIKVIGGKDPASVTNPPSFYR